MLMLPNAVKVFVSREPVNMKKSFAGLVAIIETDFKQDALTGNIFVFFNKQASKVKLIYWDRTGFAIWYKLLNQGKYRLPNIQEKLYKISISDMNLLLEGIDLTSKQRLKAL